MSKTKTSQYKFDDYLIDGFNIFIHTKNKRSDKFRTSDF